MGWAVACLWSYFLIGAVMWECGNILVEDLSSRYVARIEVGDLKEIFYIRPMSTGYQISDQNGMYFLTFTVVDWIDIFSRKVYRDMVIDSLKYCITEKQLAVYGYVIMSNHIHIILRSENASLSNTIRDFKKFTAKRIIETVESEPESRREWLMHRFAWNATQHLRNSAYQFWTHENHAIEITSRNFFEQKLKYIHENPVRAGIVERAEDYIYSSAKSLMEMKMVHMELRDWYG